MTYILNFLYVSLITVFAKESIKPSEITGTECPSIDHSANFGPVRDQSGLGFCWAHTGVDLVQEQICKEDPNKCHENLSVADAARCSWGQTFLVDSEKLKEGNFIEEAIDCALNQGICTESELPYEEAKSAIRFLAKCESPICLGDDVRRAYYEQEMLAEYELSQLSCFDQKGKIARVTGFSKYLLMTLDTI